MRIRLKRAEKGKESGEGVLETGGRMRYDVMNAAENTKRRTIINAYHALDIRETDHFIMREKNESKMFSQFK